MPLGKLKQYASWRTVMITVGAGAAAIISVIQVWQMTITPYLNSGLAPIVGRQEFAQLVQQQNTTAKILEQVGKSLQQQSDILAKTINRLDMRDCEDWNRRFHSAETALRKDPSDKLARELLNAAAEKINAIPNCMRDLN